MKKMIILYVFLISYNAFAQNATVSDKIDATNMSFRDRLALKNKASELKRTEQVPVDTQSVQFLENLKVNGSGGLATSKSLVKGADKEMIEKEKGKEPSVSEYDKLSSALDAKDGKIKEYRQVGSEEHLNGNLIKTNYIIEYENGVIQQIQFIFVKPDISGGHKLMDFNIQ